VELEVNDMKVLGAIKRGASGLRNIKNVVHLKNEELEKILDVLDQSKMITIRYGTGLLGQKKVMLGVTENGIKEMDEYADGLSKNGGRWLTLQLLAKEQPLIK